MRCQRARPVRVGVLVVLAVSVGGSSCASPPKAPVAADFHAKLMPPPSENGRLYVYRLGTFTALRFLSDIYVATAAIGTIEKNRYVVADLAPGTHLITAKTRNVRRSKVDGLSDLTVTIEPGQTYFLRVEVATWGLKPQMRLVGESEGREAIQRCFLSPKGLYGFY